MRARILPFSPENLHRVVAALRAGGIVALPTETVYGLAGCAFHPGALTAIFDVKARPTFDPLICHVAPPGGVWSGDWLDHLARLRLVDPAALAPEARQIVRRLAATFWPGPLTLVLPKTADVPDLCTSGLPTVGVRAPRHPIARQVLEGVGQPLAAPSANRFGRISPTTAAHVAAELGDRLEYILDGGACEIGLESTVLLVESDGGLRRLRPGAITAEEIAAIAGVPVDTSPARTPCATPLPSPGLLASHYAPRTPLRVIGAAPATGAALPAGVAPVRVALLRFSAAGDRLPSYLTEVLASGRPVEVAAEIVLSPSGDHAEAARRLFGALRELDDIADLDEIWAEPIPGDTGLAFAMNDRLRRASVRPT